MMIAVRQLKVSVGSINNKLNGAPLLPVSAALLAHRPNEFPTCRGKRQSPVLLPAAGAAAKALGQPDAKSSFSYGVLNNPKIVNNGHTLQVSLPADFKSDVKIPIKGTATFFRQSHQQCSCHSFFTEHK